MVTSPTTAAAPRTGPLVVVAFVALIVVILGVLAALGLFLFIRLGVPLSLDPVRKIDRDPTIVVLDRQGAKLATRLAPGPRVADLLHQAAHGRPGARNLLDAVVAIEDKDFWQQQGVNIAALAKAVVLEGRGGSTIPMQVIKNVYWGGDGGQDRFVRKFQEILFSPDLEREFTRQQLLGVYLRATPDYGDHSRGIERVAQLMFGVYPEYLSAAQAAALAATLKAPTGYDPRNIGVAGRQPPRTLDRDGRQVYSANRPLASPADCGPQGARLRNNRCRALTVLEEMHRQTESGPGAVAGRTMLDEAEYQAARAEILTLGTCDDPLHMAQQRAMGLRSPDEKLCRRTPRQFIDMAIDQVEAMGVTSRPGVALEIATTFDRDAHTALVDVAESLRRCRFPPSEVGFATFDKSGDLLSVIEIPAQGLADGVPGERYFGVPPGSTLKPFLYGAYLDRFPEVDPASPIADDNSLPALAETPGGWPLGRGGTPWWPNRGDPEATIGLGEALVQSKNRPAVRVAAALGPETIATVFRAAGVRFHGDPGSLQATAPHDFPTGAADKWAMAVIGEGGAARVRPLELIAAYTAFLNAGKAAPPRLLASVTYLAADGSRRAAVPLPVRLPRPVLTPSAAALVDGLLADVVQRGTARGLPMAALGVRGKTGTNSDGRYGWFIGYRPGDDRVSGVWLNAPPVRLRGAAGVRRVRLAVNGLDAARIFSALALRQAGDRTPIDADRLCPQAARKLDLGLRRLGAPGLAGR
ncbi:hypothetical protein IP88_02060 [alpha proteobacterium AAP81b]|nr:hypothetical protein IP88_02060 [alpha proteobacterium AAP81b]